MPHIRNIDWVLPWRESNPDYYQAAVGLVNNIERWWYSLLKVTPRTILSETMFGNNARIVDKKSLDQEEDWEQTCSPAPVQPGGGVVWCGVTQLIPVSELPLPSTPCTPPPTLTQLLASPTEGEVTLLLLRWYSLSLGHADARNLSYFCCGELFFSILVWRVYISFLFLIFWTNILW